MRIDYDFGDLEAFLAVKETRSFHAAAEQLNLSQSAVTRRIQKLENALGSILFERTTRAVKPTLAAKRLHARAEAILNNADETARAMRDESVNLAHQRAAIVTVATIPTVIARLISPAILATRASGLSARIRVLDASANEVAEAVANGDADFGLCSLPVLEPSTFFDPLFNDEIVLALPQGHILAKKTDISWNDLVGTPLIFPARGTGNRLLIDEAMGRARLPSCWTFEVGRSTTALALVSNGIGAALLPKSAIETPQVAVCKVKELDISRPVGLLSRLGQAETPATMALKTAIKAAI